MQIAQFWVARESFVYTAICLQPVSLSTALQSNKCWFRVWREGLGRILSVGTTTEHKQKLSLCSGASHVVKFFTVGGETGDRFFFFFSPLFSLVSDGSLKKHLQPSHSLLCFYWTRWDIGDEEKLQQFSTGGIWKRRIKNFFMLQNLYQWEDSVGIFQWKGLHHLCYAGERPFIRHLRGILWRVFFWKMAMDWDHRNREPSLSPAAFVNQVQYANILEGRFKQLQGKSYTDVLIWL